jgi:hypothetical protein
MPMIRHDVQLTPRKGGFVFLNEITQLDMQRPIHLKLIVREVGVEPTPKDSFNGK